MERTAATTHAAPAPAAGTAAPHHAPHTEAGGERRAPGLRLLAGPALDGRPERLDDHLARLGPLDLGAARRTLVGELEAAGILGRGGAGFPVGRKWRAIAERRGGRAVVVANGAEGEGVSRKDRVLMEHRPHLVLDGAQAAAAAIGADEIVVYVGGEHEAAIAALARALAVRHDDPVRARIVTAPVSYVAGEATAVVNRINTGDARPVTTPPRVSQRGVGGRPTLVQNVESLAYAALVGRHGAAWYREAGRGPSPGTALVTVDGDVERPGVREIELGTPLAELVADAGPRGPLEAVLVGGYFGTWAPAAEVADLVLDPAAMRDRGLSFGCGIVGLLPAGACGVATTSAILGYLARESAGQCGPCVHGLAAISATIERVARGAGAPADLANLERWRGLVTGRGACSHPDGAAQHLASAFRVFADDLGLHVGGGACGGAAWIFDAA